MKKLLVISFLLLFSNTMFAQSPVGQGEKQVNFGTGFSSFGIPLYFGMDFGVHPDITAGFNISYRSYRESYLGADYNQAIFGLFGNGNYHFNRILNIPEDWDFYAGLSVGYVIWNAASGYKGSNGSGLGIDAQIGGRYYWSDRWGVNLEFGGGNAATGGRIGVSYKL